MIVVPLVLYVTQEKRLTGGTAIMLILRRMWERHAPRVGRILLQAFFTPTASRQSLLTEVIMHPQPLWLKATAVWIGLALALSGGALAAEPTHGGTLRVAYGNRISHLDFHTAPGYELMWVAMNIGCGLVNEYVCDT